MIVFVNVFVFGLVFLLCCGDWVFKMIFLSRLSVCLGVIDLYINFKVDVVC